MIRRWYILPLRPAVTPTQAQELVDVLNAADQFIPGLLDSAAGVDLATRTVLWENTFVDEASYAGPYMVHPYHIGAIDNYVMADSPECITHDIFVARYQAPALTRTPVRSGIRRVLLFKVDTDADGAAIEALAAAPMGMESSAFGADTVGWVSAKGRATTHVWEQGFDDVAQLERYLATRDGIACSTLEGFTRLGIHLSSLKVFAYPIALTPVEQQTPKPTPANESAASYSLTMRVAIDDVDRVIEMLKRLYDPFMSGCGSPLLQRWRTVDHGYLEAEVHSTWHLDTLAAYSDLRAKTYADPAWNEFVRDAMPLVRGGTRRFHYAR